MYIDIHVILIYYENANIVNSDPNGECYTNNNSLTAAHNQFLVPMPLPAPLRYDAFSVYKNFFLVLACFLGVTKREYN